jgi:hypothetical protein
VASLARSLAEGTWPASDAAVIRVPAHGLRRPVSALRLRFPCTVALARRCAREHVGALHSASRELAPLAFNTTGDEHHAWHIQAVLCTAFCTRRGSTPRSCAATSRAPRYRHRERCSRPHEGDPQGTRQDAVACSEACEPLSPGDNGLDRKGIVRAAAHAPRRLTPPMSPRLACCISPNSPHWLRAGKIRYPASETRTHYRTSSVPGQHFPSCGLDDRVPSSEHHGRLDFSATDITSFRTKYTVGSP